MSGARATAGMVLIVVLFFVLLLAAAVASLQRRVILDTSVVRHRDAAREAEALARGGVRLAEAVLLEDLRIKLDQPGPPSLHDVWARVGTLDILQEERRSLRIEISDLGGRYNLNTIDRNPDEADPAARAWIDFFAAVIEEMPGRPEEKLYDPELLHQNLVDWIDEDGEGRRGTPEADAYLREAAAPPPNRPLLSVEELHWIDGFDTRLVRALRPYVTVYPLRGEAGINVNTAPPWILAKLQVRDASGADLHPIEDEDVRRAVEERATSLVCSGETDEFCMAVQEALNLSLEEQLEPPFADQSDVFEVRVRARVGPVERTLATTLDRSRAPEIERLDWRLL